MKVYDVGHTVCSCELESVPRGTKLEFDETGGDGHVFLKIVEMPDPKTLELNRITEEIKNIVAQNADSGDVITPVAQFVQENFTRNYE